MRRKIADSRIRILIVEKPEGFFVVEKTIYRDCRSRGKTKMIGPFSSEQDAERAARGLFVQKVDAIEADAIMEELMLAD